MFTPFSFFVPMILEVNYFNILTYICVCVYIHAYMHCTSEHACLHTHNMCIHSMDQKVPKIAVGCGRNCKHTLSTKCEKYTVITLQIL